MLNDSQKSDTMEDLLIEGRVYIKYGMPEDAERVLTHACEMNPEDLAPHLLLEELYTNTADRKKQIEAALRVGQILFKYGETKKALVYIKKVLRLEPGHGEASELLRKYEQSVPKEREKVKMIMEESEPKSATPARKPVLKSLFGDILDTPVDEGEEDIGNLFRRGQEEMRADRITEAIVIFQKVLRTNQYESETCLLLGHCFVREQHYPLAARFYRKGLQVPNQEAEYYRKLRYNLAMTYERMEKPQDAIKLYEDILDEDPSYRDVSGRLEKLKEQTQ